MSARCIGVKLQSGAYIYIYDHLRVYIYICIHMHNPYVQHDTEQHGSTSDHAEVLGDPWVQLCGSAAWWLCNPTGVLSMHKKTARQQTRVYTNQALMLGEPPLPKKWMSIGGKPLMFHQLWGMKPLEKQWPSLNPHKYGTSFSVETMSCSCCFLNLLKATPDRPRCNSGSDPFIARADVGHGHAIVG